MSEGNGRMSTMKKAEGNYRRLRNELKRATEKAKKEYFENIHEITEFQRTGCYDLMYVKTKELGWKETPRDSKYWHRRRPGE
jgi:hypothetical protein